MTPAVGVLVALAGGLGAALRFAADSFVAARNRTSVPLGTFTVNTLGSFVLGVLAGLAHLPADARLVLGTGLLGGFTTFSAASVEAVRLALRDGGRAALGAVVHAGGMLCLGVGAAAAGLWLGRLA